MTGRHAQLLDICERTGHVASGQPALLHSRVGAREDELVNPSTRRHPVLLSPPAFAGCRFPVEVITVAVRWYLRYGLSYRDVEELLAERGVEVDHVTVYRWVQRFTPLFADAARFAGTRLGTAGSSTKRMSRSAVCGDVPIDVKWLMQDPRHGPGSAHPHQRSRLPPAVTTH
jgi:hypothetical protein